VPTWLWFVDPEKWLDADDRLDLYNKWIQRGLVILVAACPCALVLASPIAVACTMAKAAQGGVIIKAADTLEKISDITCVAFDKTGTLTKGSFAVVGEWVYGSKSGLDRAEVLKMAASVESCSAHPLAAAVVSSVVPCVGSAVLVSGAAAGLYEVDDFKVLEGSGVSGTISTAGGAEHSVVIGSRKVVAEPKIDPEVPPGSESNCTLLYVVIDGNLEMSLALADELRETAPAAIAALLGNSPEKYLLTGDRPEVAQVVARQVGISATQCLASQTPDTKLAFVVQKQEANERVLMMGDGINDAPALSAAFIGVAVAPGGGGTALALQRADIALLTDDLTAVVSVHTLSKRCRSIVYANIGMVLVLKVAVLVLAVLGLVELWFAVVADVAGLVVVVVNATRLLTFNFKDAATVVSATMNPPSIRTKKVSPQAAVTSKNPLMKSAAEKTTYTSLV